MYNLYVFHTNRPDLTKKAVDSAKGYFNIYVIDNSKNQELSNNDNYLFNDQEYLNNWVYTPPIPFTFLQSQKLIHAWEKDSSDGNPFYFWMHNDGEFIDSPQKLIDYTETIHKEQEGKWSVVFTHYDVACAFNTNALTAIGGWGDYFEQYFLDNHVYRQLRLAGYPTFNSGVNVHHYVSQTIYSDPEKMMRHRILWPLYSQLYEIGWGGKAGEETYETFFNLPKKEYL